MEQPPAPYVSPVQIMRQHGWLTIKEVQRHFATRPSLQTIRWWMKVGMHNRREKGERITLRHEREGNALLTTVTWIAEFKSACQANTKARTKP